MTNRNWVVGVFVVAGLVMFTIGIYMVGDRHQAFAKHLEYYAEFKDLAGLSQGAKVRVGGMDAGEVVAIGVPDFPAMRFRVKLQIDEEMRALVRADSVATIETEGIVGETFVLVRPGTPGALAAPELATLPSTEPLNLVDLLNQGSGLLTEADGTLKDLKELTGNLNGMNGKMNVALDAATTTLFNVNDVVVGLKQGRGPAGMFLRDDAVATSLRQSITNVQQTTSTLNHTSGQADVLIGQAGAIVADLQSRQLPRTADDALERIRSAASNMDDGSRQLDQIMAQVMKPDDQGANAADNIREALSNMNAATSNMTDDTEALKHNFLLRGFFRRRGYFKLTDLPADKYRGDKVFMDPANHRVWLSAAELFHTPPNGVEGLSPHGKAMLDTAMAQLGDAALLGPIVIEGYRDSGDPASQLLQARSRALLVSQYLEDHLQIEQRNLGVVSMKNTPPGGMGRTTWDGICVVTINRR
jgi:phospholipid/cholesterol/gamma-HCH transport system substrate-binding protein